MQIKNRLTGTVLHDTGDADLRGADLSGSDLRDADLRGEKLKSNPVFIYGLTWFITVTNDTGNGPRQAHLAEGPR